MPLKIIRQDITKIECDAIVNPSNCFLSPGGGTDLSVHKAAGPDLLKACEAAGGCEVGKAKLTPGFNLPCKYVIHTAGPEWDRTENTKDLLASCYYECLHLAKENGCETVAFPLISAGTHGFPEEEVLKIATRVIGDFLFENEMLIYLVVYDKKAFGISKKIFCDVLAFIDDNYIPEHSEKNESRKLSDMFTTRFRLSFPDECTTTCEESEEELVPPQPVDFEVCATMPVQSLDDMLRNMDKGFAQTLFDLIDEKGLTDVECYKRSNVDKKTFSKIKCNKDYKPSKKTAVSFAIGLRLSAKETEHLLATAGFCLSNSNMFDVIIQYFVSTGNYDNIFEVNEVLYRFDQVTLGV